jgi:hypothetical protein
MGARGWPTQRHDDGNTWDNSNESKLSTATIRQLHPESHVPDRRTQFGDLVESGGRLFGPCLPQPRGAVRICAWNEQWHVLWSVVVKGGNSDEYSLVVTDGRVIANSTHGVSFVALGTSTGRRLWSVTGPGPGSDIAQSSPIVRGHRFTYENGTDRIVQRSSITGRLLSSVRLTRLANTPHNRKLVAEVSGYLVADGLIFGFDDADDIVALPVRCTTASCPPVWEAERPRDSVQLAYSQGRLYSDGGPAADGVSAFDAKTGAPLFSLNQVITEDPEPFLNYIIADNLVIATDGLGRVQAWPSDGCGASECGPVLDVVPTSSVGTDEASIEVGGKLFTPGSYVYALSTHHPSPYGLSAAPTSLKASYDHATCSVDLAWTAPTDSGRLPLTSSVVTASDGETSNGGPNSGSFSRLDAGTYTFHAAEQTAWGTGPSSRSSASLAVPTCDN